MFRLAPRDREELPDVIAFADLASRRTFLFDHREVFVARAPGRLDVMGGIADYSGSLVMPMPIAEACLVGVQRAEDGVIRIVSIGDDRDHTFELAAARAGELFDAKHRGKWYSYVAGVFAILRDAKGIDFSAGARVLVRSDVPIGKGVSSSAALEVSTMNAVCAAFGIGIEPRELAILCQRVENTIVGAACGVMDQMASNCGTEGSLLSMVCQPAEVGDPVKIPRELGVWGIDSGVRHSVSGSDYGSVRAAAFMGYRIIAEVAGLNVEGTGDGLVSVEDTRWNGYVGNVGVNEYESNFRDSIPDSLTGREFFERYLGTTDKVAAIDRDRDYAVKASTEHAIYESSRVRDFAVMLGGPIDDKSASKLGEMLYGSHVGYRNCRLTEEGTELLVSIAVERRSDGIYGARITGGGSGGTVTILADSDAGDVVDQIAAIYRERAGRGGRIFQGSSPGCAEYGVVRLVPS